MYRTVFRRPVFPYRGCGVGLGLGSVGKVNRCADCSGSGLCGEPEGLIDLRLSGGGFERHDTTLFRGHRRPSCSPEPDNRSQYRRWASRWIGNGRAIHKRLRTLRVRRQWPNRAGPLAARTAGGVRPLRISRSICGRFWSPQRHQLGLSITSMEFTAASEIGVPEPASLAMLSVGLVWGVRRRTRIG